MADITMPRLSDTMEEGTISRWLKKVGDTIERGEVIAEIQTDKATMDLEAYEAGVLGAILVGEGETAPIGRVIARTQLAESSAEEATLAAPAAGTPPPSGRTASPDAVRVESTPGASTANGEHLRATPLARAKARELGVDLREVHGSGPSGRVVRADVEAAAQAALTTPSPEPLRPLPPPASASVAPARSPAVAVEVLQRPTAAPAEAGVEEVPLTNVQRVAARRLMESAQTTPHFHLTRSVDAEPLVALRADLNRRLAEAEDGVQVTVTDLLVKACATAVRAAPELNVSWGGDRLLRHRRINIGIAVATASGLVVPVLSDADQKSVRQIALEAKALIAKARAGRLVPSEFTGGTFTISNLGMYGIEQFTAIINPPEAALLAVGAITPQVVAQDGVASVRRRFTVTLGIDHRAVDGATGAQFLERLVNFLQDPLRILA